MDFVGIVIFAIVLYVRPQEMFGFLNALRPAFLSLAIAGLGLFIRPGGVNPRQIVRTPQDWMVLTYFLYILFFTPGSFGDLWGRSINTSVSTFWSFWPSPISSASTSICGGGAAPSCSSRCWRCSA